MKNATPSEVVAAGPADEEPLMDLLCLMHQEQGLGEMDEEKAREVLRRGLRLEDAIVGVIRGRRAIEGSIGLFVGTWWYSSDRHLTDLWSFVPETYRRSDHAKALIAFAKRAATELEKPLVMSMIENELTAQKLKLYERQLPKAGALFIFNRPKVAQAATAA